MLHWFNPATPVPGQDLDYQCYMSWSFLFSVSYQVMYKVIVYFVGIGGIVYITV